MAQKLDLDATIKQHDVQITPDNKIFIGAIGKTVDVPTDSRVDLAGYIDGVVRAEQRAQTLRTQVAAGQGQPDVPGTIKSPIDAAMDKIKSYGVIPSALTDLGIGAAKGLGDTSTNIARAVPGVGRFAVNPQAQSEMMAPTSVPQQIGKSAEQVGEYVAPELSGATGAVRTGLLKQAIKLPAGYDSAAMMLSKIIPNMAGAAGVAGAQGQSPATAAAFAGVSPMILSQIGKLAVNNPVAAARLTQAIGLGGIISTPELWQKFVSAVGLTATPEAVAKFGQALQNVAINRPAGAAITGVGTRFIDKLSNYSGLSSPGGVGGVAASGIPGAPGAPGLGGPTQ